MYAHLVGVKESTFFQPPYLSRDAPDLQQLIRGRATGIKFSSSPEKDGLGNTIFSTLRFGGGVRDT